jgi:hypothetical protein
MKKILSLAIAATSLTLSFSVPVFAETETPDTEQISATGTITADMLISGLNAEVDRINSNDSWEDVDYMSNPGLELVFDAIKPINFETATTQEIDEFTKSRFQVIDRVWQYADAIPREDVDRWFYFQNTVGYMLELVTVD